MSRVGQPCLPLCSRIGGTTLLILPWSVQGDSGFLILRDGFVSFRSPVLQHFFDCPLQFGAVPEHTQVSDYAEDADLFEIEVRFFINIVLNSLC